MITDLKYPKLLFIARWFPPYSFTAGVRAKNIAKYLSLLGWNVTVVTVNMEGRRREIDAKSLIHDLEKRKIFILKTSHSLRFLDPSLSQFTYNFGEYFVKGIRYFLKKFDIDYAVGWVPHIIRASKKISFDIIMATGNPFSSFIAAEYIGKRYSVPYVLDYRDPWTFSPHRRPARWWIKKLERHLLNKAAFATTVSPSWAHAIGKNAGIDGKFKVISNGFDPDDVQDIQAWHFERPAMVYAGIFYPPKRVITPILAAMSRLKDRLPPKLRPQLHYFGVSEKHVRREAIRLGVEDDVVFHGVVPRREVLQALKGAVLAPVITSVMPEGDLVDRGIVTGKIFEVLNVKTPILLIAPRGSDARIIVEKSNAGEAFTGDDIEGIANFIERVCKGQVHFTFEGRDEWAWPNIIKKLDGYLREALEKAHRERKT